MSGERIAAHLRALALAAGAEQLAVEATALEERVGESRREVESEMAEALRRASQDARGALEWARVV